MALDVQTVRSQVKSVHHLADEVETFIDRRLSTTTDDPDSGIIISLVGRGFRYSQELVDIVGQRYKLSGWRLTFVRTETELLKVTLAALR